MAPRQEFVVVVVELPLSGLVGLTVYQDRDRGTRCWHIQAATIVCGQGVRGNTYERKEGMSPTECMDISFASVVR